MMTQQPHDTRMHGCSSGASGLLRVLPCAQVMHAQEKVDNPDVSEL